MLGIVWPAISIAAFDSELAALLAMRAATALLFLDLSIMAPAQRPQVIESISRTWMRHQWTRLNVVCNNGTRMTTNHDAAIAVSSKTGLAKRAPMRRLVVRVRWATHAADVARGRKQYRCQKLPGVVLAILAKFCKNYMCASFLSTISL
jgi:hypothetical protein